MTAAPAKEGDRRRDWLLGRRGAREYAGTNSRRAAAQHASLVFVSVNGALAGALALVDRPRETAREAIGLLREQGVRRVAMLTGDHARTSARIAEELGLDLRRSIYIGDRLKDVLPARALGGTGILVRTGYGESEAHDAPGWVRIVDDLPAAARATAAAP